MTPAELEAELASLRRELAAARGIAEAALSAAEAARNELEQLRARPPGSDVVHLGPQLGRALVDHLSSGPDPVPAPAAAAAPSGPRPPPVSLYSLAELVSDDPSPAPAVAELAPRPSSLLAAVASAAPTGTIDLDRVDGVANDEEERRKARLAALEARLQRTDFDAARRARLLELAQTRKVPDPGRSHGGLVVALLLAGAAVAADVWPLAFVPPVILLSFHLWRREQNEHLARLARGFAVPLHGRVLRDAGEVLAWFNAFWPALVRPQDVWTSHRHVAVASEPDDFPVLLDVQLQRAAVEGVDYRPRVDFYVATTWPARLPLLRPGSSEMSPAIAELYARLRRAGFTIRVESEAGLLLHGSDSVVERVRNDPAQLGTLHGIVRDAIALARQLGATPAPTLTVPARTPA